MSEKRATLEEKLIAICGWDMAQNIRVMLADHFQIEKLELDVGDVKLKSDNSLLNTIITIGDKVLPVMSIHWCIDNEEWGRLTLTFM